MSDRITCSICGGTYLNTLGGIVDHMNGLLHQTESVLLTLRALDRKRTSYPAFNSVKTCAKCDHKFKMVTPTTKYNPVKNTMTRGCHCCGYHWEELCADGSEAKE